MLPSRKGAHFKWILVVLLGICKLQRGVGSEEGLEDCIAYQCCEDECCGPDTSWDTDIEYCKLDPGASGFLGIFAPDFLPVCAVRICCEDSCCFDGTYYDPSIQSCLPLTMPADESPVVPTPSPTASPNSSPTATEAPTIVILLPLLTAPAFRPNVCGAAIEDAVAFCQNTTTCNQADIDEDCYDPCDFFDPSTCPQGQTCFSFVSGCKDFAPPFPNVPFDPSILP